jgi:hypothetical protein
MQKAKEWNGGTCSLKAAQDRRHVKNESSVEIDMLDRTTYYNYHAALSGVKASCGKKPSHIRRIPQMPTRRDASGGRGDREDNEARIGKTQMAEGLKRQATRALRKIRHGRHNYRLDATAI